MVGCFCCKRWGVVHCLRPKAASATALRAFSYAGHLGEILLKHNRMQSKRALRFPGEERVVNQKRVLAFHMVFITT